MRPDMRQTSRFPAHHQPRQRGIALIEAMVGIMIFAFGVLGLIGLQASMTKAQTGAKFRADAANLGNELIGQMWSDNAANLASYATERCESYTRCKDWAAKLEQSLPAADYKVVVDGNTGNVDLTIEWSQPGDGKHSYQTTAVVWVQP
jgi:type IV pilus assembly protein PilV